MTGMMVILWQLLLLVTTNRPQGGLLMEGLMVVIIGSGL